MSASRFFISEKHPRECMPNDRGGNIRPGKRRLDMEKENKILPGKNRRMGGGIYRLPREFAAFTGRR
jgi:hypothetical protein